MKTLWLSLALSALTAAIGCGTSTHTGSAGGQAHGGNKRIIILTNGNSPFWDACRVGLQEADKDLKLKDAGFKAVLDVNDGTPKGQIDKLRQYASQSDVVAVGVSALDASNAEVADRMREL